MSFLERVDQTIRRSAVWRSLFRQPYPNDERSRAYAVMNNVFLHIHPVRVRQHAVKFAYTFCLGGLSFFLFLVLTVTGVYLMFFYVPSATQAYTNILEIQSQVTFGLLTRNIHRWAAHLMVFFVFLHMMRVFYHGAYKPPREFNWVVGVVLLFLTIMLSFTGYLLPWDQIAYWAITIGTNMGGYAPLFNTPTKLILLGGLEVGQNTLLRFYVLHVIFLPLIAADLPGGPLLADPQGRRHQRAALMTDTKTADRDREAGRPAGRPDPADGDRQAARADVGAAVPAARAGQAGRRRPGPEGTRRHGHDLAAPARDRVPGGRRDEHLPAADGPVHQRPARGAGERQRDAGRGQGAVVLPRPPGAAGLLPPDGRRRPRPALRARRGGAHPVHRPRRTSWPCARRERKTAVMLFTMFCCLGLIVTFVGIFFRGPGYSFVIPYVTSPGLHFAL